MYRNFSVMKENAESCMDEKKGDNFMSYSQFFDAF